MTLTDIFWGIGDIMTWSFQALQANAIGDWFNIACICLGFVGLFYWLNLQRKFNAKAENDPNQLK